MSLHQAPAAKPRPRISPDNSPFWEACREHRLRLPFCMECGKAHLPPGPVCPHCFSDSLEWRDAGGRGVISTWVVVHKVWFPAFAGETPYNVVQVELEEGPRLTAKMVGLDGQPITVGQKVAIDFEDVDDALTLPCFRLV